MAPSTAQAIKVLIVDDSPSARAMLRHIVESDPALTVMAVAADAMAAARTMRTALPDVILLDLEMPGMDGLTFLRKIMAQHPMPVVVCSSATERGSDQSIAALDAGAVEAVLKPGRGNPAQRSEGALRICDALRAAARTRGVSAAMMAQFHAPGPKLTADEILPPPTFLRPAPRTEPIVCIGASTGGTDALLRVLTMLPADAPAIAIVQHMPEGFTGAFARRLDSACALSVAEATDGAQLGTGRAVVARGDHHLLLRRGPGAYRVSVQGGPCVSRHRPSVDVLFRSAATAAGANAMGIILTGMGDDGARCMAEMRQAGSPTVAQDEATCAVYGMPREAVQAGAVGLSLPLDKMAAAIMNFARRHRMGESA